MPAKSGSGRKKPSAYSANSNDHKERYIIMKKILAVLLAVMMMLSLSSVSFAADNSKNGNLQFRFMLHQLIGCEDATGTGTDNDDVIIHKSSP